MRLRCHQSLILPVACLNRPSAPAFSTSDYCRGPRMRGRAGGGEGSTPRHIQNLRSSHWLSETCSRSCSVCAGDAGVLLRANVR